uniref:Uncharacterized protein n=1 Tax=Timema shepardi TaxID=629360 RepID=A0A7R9G2V5_TIMSH|nr:unnamed protein product [Timema shepardi]
MAKENRSCRRQTTYAADSTIVVIADRSYSPTASRTGLLVSMSDTEPRHDDLLSSRLSYRRGPPRHTVPDGPQLVLSRGRDPLLVPDSQLILTNNSNNDNMELNLLKSVANDVREMKESLNCWTSRMDKADDEITKLNNEFSVSGFAGSNNTRKPMQKLCSQQPTEWAWSRGVTMQSAQISRYVRVKQTWGSGVWSQEREGTCVDLIGLLSVVCYICSVVAVTLSALGGGAIKCFECNSHNDSRCSLDVLPVELKKDCSEHKEGTKYTMCRKIVQHIDFEVNGIELIKCDMIDVVTKRGKIVLLLKNSKIYKHRDLTSGGNRPDTYHQRRNGRKQVPYQSIREVDNTRLDPTNIAATYIQIHGSTDEHVMFNDQL